MKGLALAYSKDMQEDKEAVFDAADTIGLMLAAAEGMVRDMKPVPENLPPPAALGFSTATDLADWLVRAAGLPFREAHHVTGRLVRLAEERGCGLAELTLAEMQAVGRTHHRGRLLRPLGRGLGRQPHLRGRHRARPRPRAGRRPGADGWRKPDDRASPC